MLGHQKCLRYTVNLFTLFISLLHEFPVNLHAVTTEVLYLEYSIVMDMCRTRIPF